jgi:hypothetical protein
LVALSEAAAADVSDDVEADVVKLVEGSVDDIDDDDDEGCWVLQSIL